MSMVSVRPRSQGAGPLGGDLVDGEPTHGAISWSHRPPGRSRPPAGNGERRSLLASVAARRRRHRVVYVLMAVVVLVIAAIGYVALSYEFRSIPGARSLRSAVSAFRAGHPDSVDANLRYVPPEQGVYELEGRGSERISFPPNSQTDGTVMPASVTSLDRGCWRWHVDYNVAHWEEYDFCPHGAQLIQTGNRNYQSWDFGTLSVTNMATFNCPTGSAVVLPEDLVSGDAMRWTCSGTNTSVSGRTTAKVVSRIVGVVTLSVGRQRVGAVHELQVTTLSGGQKGTVSENWWFSTASGLPLRVDRHITILTASPLGTITYHEDGTWHMVSLSPRT